MTIKLDVLQCGSCERLKLGIHGTALGLAVVNGIVNGFLGEPIEMQGGRQFE